MMSARLAAAAVALPLLVSGCGTGSDRPVSVPTSPHADGSARNLALSPHVIDQLVVAAAASKQVPAAGFSGLEQAQRYYAYDPASRTWWAAASLRAKNPDGRAAISLNDAGAYDVFHRTAGGQWVARDSAYAGQPDLPLSRCSDWPPRSVLRLWHWSLKVCRVPH